MRTWIVAMGIGLVAAGAGCTTKAVVPSAVERMEERHPMLVRAERAYLRGNLDESLELFRGYREGFAPRAAASEAHYWEGLILLEQGRLDEARRHLEAAAYRASGRLLAANAYMALGDCALAVDRLQTAAAHYQRSIDLQEPEARNDYALYRLGVTRQRLGDWGGGQSYYKLLLRDHPRSPLVPRVEERLRFPGRAFYLEVGAFQTEGAAEQMALHIRSHGHEARVIASDGDSFRVWVGGYPRYEAARAAAPTFEAISGRTPDIVP